MADDPWAEFSPQSPAKTTDPWADFAPEQDTSVTASGTAKQYGVGVGKGLINIAGMGGDLRELAGAGTDWIASKFQKPKTMSDLITQGEGAPASASFDERFSGKAPITAGDVAKSFLRSTMPLVFNMPTSGDILAKVESLTGQFRKPQNFVEQVANTAGEFTPAMVGGPMNAGRNVATRVAKTFATNVAAPAVASEAAGEIPGVKGSAAEPFVKAGAAIMTPAALSATRSAFTPVVAPSNRQAAADYLKGEGVKDLMAGQITGSEKQQYREATAGWKYDAKRQGQLDQLSAAALGRIGETGSDVLSGVQVARPKIVNQMEQSAKNLIVRQDSALTDALVGKNMEGELFKSGLSADQERRILALRDNVLNQFETVARKGKNAATPWTEMSGEAFHNLIKKGSPLDRAIDSTDSEVSHWASRMKSEIMDAAERTAFRQGTREGVGNRQALADFQDSRHKYANLVALEKAISKTGSTAANGTLSPAGVFAAATNRDRLDYAKGRGDFNKLAQASNLLMTSLPQSGTQPRLMAQMPAKMIGGSIGGAGTMAAGLLAGSPLTGGLSALPLVAGALGGWVGPKAQNSFVMSKRGQYLAGNRPAGSQPYPGLTNEEQLRRLLLLSRPAIASSQNEYGR